MIKNTCDSFSLTVSNILYGLHLKTTYLLIQLVNRSATKRRHVLPRSKGTLDGCSLAGSSVRGKRFRKLIPAGDGVTLDLLRFKISSIINKRESG